MPNPIDLRDVPAADIIAAIRARGEPFVHEILCGWTPVFLTRHVMARQGGLSGAVHHISPRELRTFAARRFDEQLESCAPAGPWDSERERTAAINRTAADWPEDMAIAALATGCGCNADDVRIAIEAGLDRTCDSYSSEEEEEAPAVRNRANGALPGRSDGPEWSTTE